MAREAIISIPITEKIVQAKNYLVKSNLPSFNYVINPYGGCTFACKYCYASFMKRFTNHREKWGSYLDIKDAPLSFNKQRLKGKTIFLSSVTDPYNFLEQKYKITQKILEQLVDVDAPVTICTKSSLILRDLSLLQRFKNLRVAFSINTLDEQFKNDMDNASTIAQRLHSLQTLKEHNIYTILFISPIFPQITNCQHIMSCTRSFIDEYWLENLKLRGTYKMPILNYINTYYPQYKNLYQQIYERGEMSYWNNLSEQIKQYCQGQSMIVKYYLSKDVKENE